MPTEPRHAAVVGKPVAHSLSPVLHTAAYEALGLNWTYTRLEASEAELPALVANLDESWVGLSVTMPGKRAALEVATTTTPRARAVGAANTLVRTADGWAADCTDVDGVTGALRAVGYVPGPEGVVLGAGGTACAALAGLAALGVSSATVVVRDMTRASEAVACASAVGLAVEVLAWASADFTGLASSTSVLVNTTPPAAVQELVPALSLAPCVLDVIYHPWPTPLAASVADRGGVLATGLDMLLHQAFGQVAQFTGREPPREAMREALRTNTGGLLPLPLQSG
ncbi:shikimate dehydrogenase [Actinophytocola oryzae]|uniref:Shikimate dehydrogenase n=1 Tax=Actinophytocola oryzae TaxID=502181 RepID=A0A4R7VHX3_9PSEU|nr:shikimate dehydrogenase [Actinophytocola oryzae]TDV48964.1 shikimate dehydrogenase [Actinophytocola oryzae]